MSENSEIRREISGKKVFLLITGASRGLGKSIALGFADELGEGSLITLVARNQEKLSSVKSEIISKHPELEVRVIDKDLTDLDSNLASDLLKTAIGSRTLNFDKVILVHNAGSLGSLSKTVDDLDNISDWRKYLDLNLNSVIVLNAVFLKTFQDYVKDEKKCLVVNVSSLAATQPFAGWAQYCAGKAARDSYFKVCATEFPNIKVLNYAPGPLETDMTDEIIAQALPSVRQWFVEARAEKKLVSCSDSVHKLLAILNEDTFVSGQHIDYFD